MKKFFLVGVFLIGLMAYSCVAPPDVGLKQNGVKTEFVEAVDYQVAVPVIMVADDATLPAPDTPDPVKWIDENFWTLLATIAYATYEFLALKLRSGKTLTIIGNLYKLLTYFIPDKTKNGGNFAIRDKLTQDKE
jgi:hypothetical protein